MTSITSSQQIYLQPATIAEALEATLQHQEHFKYIAGGTDVMVNRYQGNETSNCLIDLTKIHELKGIHKEGEYLRIGALEKLSGLKAHRKIEASFPALIEAAHSVGSPLIRKTATIGGNILCENRCVFYNQSEWWREAVGYCLKCDGAVCIATGGKKACFSELVADTVPALISMDASIEISDTDGEKTIKLEDIYTGDGVHPRNLSNTAILKAVLLPLNRNFRSVFKKLRQRESLEFTSLTTAVTVDKNDDLTIAVAGVDPKPVVVKGKAGDDREILIKQAMKGARAVDNDMFSRNYRRKMIRIFIEKSLEELLKQ